MEEVNSEVKKDNVIEDIKGDDFSDIFITEKDTFDVTLKYYKKDNKIYTDSGTDTDFSPEEPSKSITITLKYPDQSDCVTIASATPKMNGDIEKIDIRDFLSMELTRIIILIRGWSINKKLDSRAIMGLNTKIIKGLLVKTREKIGMEGIL